VKIYPIEPFNDGNAFIEYVVLNKELGDLDMAKLSPRGTVKSKIAVEMQ
jgi:hypothetical protein